MLEERIDVWSWLIEPGHSSLLVVALLVLKPFVPFAPFVPFVPFVLFVSFVLQLVFTGDA
jgi:hypothetical protein